MNKHNDIKQLIDRFFDGDTTLEEEQRLYAFFRDKKDLPEELETYRDMFVGLDAIAFDDTWKAKGLTAIVVSMPVMARKRKFIYWASGIAAAILLCIGITLAFDVQKDNSLENIYAGSYVIVGGQRIDDLSRIKPDIEKALSHASEIEGHIHESSVVERAEQSILDNVEDPAEKARIEQLLNE